MSDIFEEPTQLPIPDELTVLRERAKVLGIKVSGNIGVDTLRQKIEDHLAGVKSDEEEEQPEVNDENDDEDNDTSNDDVAQSSGSDDDEEEELLRQKQAEEEAAKAKAASAVKPTEKVNLDVAPKGETLAQKAKRLRLKHLRLIRVRVTCMNPAKKDMTGEIVTVANKYIGKVSKLVPFNLEEPYHIPHVLYEELKARRFTNVKTVRKNGVDVVDPEAMRNVPEFAIEVLDPLTEEELNNLKIQQARSNSVGD